MVISKLRKPNKSDALLAVINDNEIKANEILNDMRVTELETLKVAAIKLFLLCRNKLQDE